MAGNPYYRNEEQLVLVLAGIETERGTAATVTRKVYEHVHFTDSRDPEDFNENTGTFDPWQTFAQKAVKVAGTASGPMTFEDGPWWAELGVKGGVTGVTDSNTTPGYTYTFSPTGATDDKASATFMYGAPDNVYQTVLGMVSQFTIKGDTDADASWQYDAQLIGQSKDPLTSYSGTATSGTTTTIVKTGAGWTTNQWAGGIVEITAGTGSGQRRLVTSNNATTLTVPTWTVTPDATSVFTVSPTFTAGISDRTREYIRCPGTLVYLDDSGGTIGTTAINAQAISFSVTWNDNAYLKQFLENVTSYSNVAGRGMREITAQLRIEFRDDKEYAHYRAGDWRRLRIQRAGSVIDSGAGSTKLAQINLPRMYWVSADDNQPRQNNRTLTLGARGYTDLTAGYAGQLVFKNALATLA